MIRHPCPSCDKMLGIPDNLAGRIVVCPKCKEKLRVPTPEPEEEGDDAEEHVAPRPQPKRPAPPRKPRRPVEVEDEEQEDVEEQVTARRPRRPAEVEPEEEEDEAPARRPRRQAEVEDEEEPAEEEPVRRKRKRKKKRRRRSSAGAGMSPLLIGGIAAGGVCLVLGLVAFFVPAVALIPILLGCGMVVIGGIWMLIVAFQDDLLQGILCWFIPCYVFYYVIVNWATEKNAFLTWVAGIALLMVGSCAGGVGGARMAGDLPPPTRHGQLQTSWPAGETFAC
jgi:hypothetical protein